MRALVGRSGRGVLGALHPLFGGIFSEVRLRSIIFLPLGKVRTIIQQEAGWKMMQGRKTIIGRHGDRSKNVGRLVRCLGHRTSIGRERGDTRGINRGENVGRLVAAAHCMAEPHSKGAASGNDRSVCYTKSIRHKTCIGRKRGYTCGTCIGRKKSSGAGLVDHPGKSPSLFGGAIKSVSDECGFPVSDNRGRVGDRGDNNKSGRSGANTGNLTHRSHRRG